MTEQILPRAAAAPTVLVVDDNIDLADTIAALIERDGMRTKTAYSGRGALRKLEEFTPDLVLLDLILPDMNGLDVLRSIRARARSMPVIVLSARGDAIDRAVGLEMGADDYIAKPFDGRELIARIRAVLRRFEGSAASAPRLAFGNAVLDFTARTFKVRDTEVPLSALEFRLLAALACRPGLPIDRESLTRAAQLGRYQPLERAVDVQIARLRKKLREAAPEADWIATVRGSGYAFEPPEPFDD